jgi:septal ring factor EnvC (AmiA/AmiB activator)
MADDTPDTGTDAPTDAPTDDKPSDTDDTDWKAEAEKFKTLARKHEDRAKANASAAKELEQVKQASMSDQEKAVELAKQQARAEVLMEVASERVADAVRLAAAGRPVDVDALLDGLDRTRFVTDEGTPDTDAITAWVDRIAPKPADGFPAADLGQGSRTGSQTPLGSDPLLNTLKQSIGIR